MLEVTIYYDMLLFRKFFSNRVPNELLENWEKLSLLKYPFQLNIYIQVVVANVEFESQNSKEKNAFF